MKLSILISSPKGRLPHFKRALNSLYYQDSDFSKVELLFLNNNGEPELLDVLRRYSGKFKIRYFELMNEEKRLYICQKRNFLIRQAKGKYVLTTEPEILHYSNTIGQVLTAFQKYGNNIWYCGKVYGGTSFAHVDGRAASLSYDSFDEKELELLGKEPKSNQKMDLQFYQKNSKYHALDGNQFIPLIFCTAIAKEYLIKVRGFNEQMRIWGYDEDEIFTRLQKVGVKRVFDPNFVTYHLPHSFSLTIAQKETWLSYNRNVPFLNDEQWGTLEGMPCNEIEI